MIETFNKLSEVLSSNKPILRFLSTLFLILMVSACSGIAEKPQTDHDIAANNTAKQIEKVKVIDALALKEYQTALTYLDQGKLPEANKLLKSIVERHPDLAAPLYNLGLISEEQSDQDTAELYYTRAIEVDSKYYLALNNLGVIARSKGQFNKASRYYTKGLQVAPDSPDLHYNLAVLNEIYLHDYVMAIKHYEQYLALVDSSASGSADKNVSSWIKDLKRRSR
jgi:tetratricopeptide (TPR) repeat protein